MTDDTKLEYSAPEIEVLGDLHTVTAAALAPGRGDFPLGILNIGGNPKGS